MTAFPEESREVLKVRTSMGVYDPKIIRKVRGLDPKIINPGLLVKGPINFSGGCGTGWQCGNCVHRWRAVSI